MTRKDTNQWLQTIRICPITEREDAAMASLVRWNLEQFGLDIPGTAYFDPELAHLSRYYAQNPEKRAYFVALSEDGTVLGGAGLAEFEAIASCAELQKLYLAENAKRAGLGTMLVQLVSQTAKKMGYQKLYLETHTNLNAACCLYEKLGFVRIQPPAPVQHGTMNCFYWKDL